MTAVTDMPDLTSYRRSQLAATLEFLRQRSPFYRDRLKEPDITVDNAAEMLRGLPPLTPDDWESARLSIRTGPLDGASFGYSGGTTATPKIFVSAAAELAAIHETFGSSD